MPSRILVADSVTTHRIFLKANLSADLYDVACVKSEDELLKSAFNAPPSLIMLSQEIAGPKTAELCQMLKSDPRTSDVPIALMMINPNGQETIDALTAGVDDVLAMPFSDDGLHARVRALMRQSTTSKDLRRQYNTARALGFAEPQLTISRKERISLICADPYKADRLRENLSLYMDEPIDLVTADDLLAHMMLDGASDLYLVCARLGGQLRGLPVLSNIRSSTSGRYSSVVIFDDTDNPNTITQALDMGADEVIDVRMEPLEMALRLKAQLARKRKFDMLRSVVDEGLRMAAKDPLTGIYNRRYALAHLQKLSLDTKTEDACCAVMLLDVDHFKQINDTYGHASGDEVLVALTERLQQNLRGMDLLARYGGEEFLICLPMTDLSDAQASAEKLRIALCEDPILLSNGAQVQLSASIGLCVVRQSRLREMGDLTQIISATDEALYCAKSSGRNKVSLTQNLH